MSGMIAGAGICIGCGLCCDGTLFGHGKLTSFEAESSQSSALELFEHEGSTAFRQPCAHFDCGRCAIYEGRFRTCREFECALLKRVNAGETDAAGARAQIELAKQLVGAIAVSDPKATTAVGRAKDRARLAEELKRADRGRDVARRLLNMVALDAHLERHFRHEKKVQSEPTNRTSG